MNHSYLFVALFSFLFWNNNVFAQEKGTKMVLTLDKVVSSAMKHYPQIFSQHEEIRAREAELLAANGFFDLRLRQQYKDGTRGYYDGKITDTELEQNLGVFGSKIYGGYRKSYGGFADYDGDQVTNSGGEFSFGTKFSLLKGRDIDQGRLALILEKLSVEEAEIELKAIKMEIKRDATKAYWLWVTSGETLRIYTDLYELSLNRQKQLEAKLKAGDIAQIILVENKKNLLKREASLLKIRQQFEASSIYLSLFFRDERGSLLKPKLEDLPNLPEINLEPPREDELAFKKSYAVLNRPEVQMMRIKEREEQNALKYAQNILQPELDVELGVSKDIGEGPKEISESKNYVNLNFSIPLQRSEGRGKVSAAKSKIQAISHNIRMLEDKIQTEIDQIVTEIRASARMFAILNEEVELSKILQVAESKRFREGASNFFLVNMREQDLAFAKAAAIEALKDFYISKADYELAVFAEDAL